MDEHQRSLYNKGFAIVDCGGEGDCLYRVLAFLLFDDASK